MRPVSKMVCSGVTMQHSLHLKTLKTLVQNFRCQAEKFENRLLEGRPINSISGPHP
jgi:hypothetical protein